MSNQRRRYFFQGRVQGVGFRYTAARISSRFDVRGFVKNLDDGRVELLVEGLPGVIDSFIEAVRAELGDKIQRVGVEPEASDPPLEPGFQIAF